jgi:hypothetical protein
LTIAAATFVFSVFDAVLLRPFPFRNPDQLVAIRTFRLGASGPAGGVSLCVFEDWDRQPRAFSQLAATFTFSNKLTGRSVAQSLRMTFATPELFDLFGVQPMLGRTFTPAENQLGGDVLKIVLSYASGSNCSESAPTPSTRDCTCAVRHTPSSV